MKYLSLFSGIGGFELGIDLAYENNKTRRDKTDSNKKETRHSKGDKSVSQGSQSRNNTGDSKPTKTTKDSSGALLQDRPESSNTDTRGMEEIEEDIETRQSVGQGGIGNLSEGGDIRDKQEILQRQRDKSDTRSKCEQPICIGFSEIDKYATQVYQKHFPNHKNYGDITKINEKELPDFDLLVGGFPCQAFSIAGKRRGFEDTRGTLFFDIARIVREKQPRLLLLENVKGLLSHDKGNTFRTIIATLDELGYDAQWQVLNSKNHGVPQNRERIFIIGHLRGTSRPEVFPFGEESTEDTRRVGEEVAYCLDANYAKGTNTIKKGRRQIVQVNQPKHSNDRVYDPKGVSPTLNTMQGGNRQPFVKIKEATKKGYAEATEGDSINLSVPNSKTRRGRVGKGVAQTLDTGMHQHTLQGGSIRRLTPTECMRLQGFPDTWCNGLGISDTQKYKVAGNAVTVNVIRDICEKLLK